MSNTIDKNIVSGDNSISKLNFLWKAKLNNDIIIKQLDDEGKEHRYQEIKDNFDKLKYFYLTNNKDKTFIVDLINGFIYLNKRQRNLFDDKLEKKNIRLIYFRRKQISIKIGKTKHKFPKGDIVRYFLGFQYNDLEGRNHKILLQINDEGNVIIGD